MPTLAELQHSLQDFLLDKTDKAAQLTLETAQFPRQVRLQIYHQAYRLRLIDTLRNDFPALERAVGESEFTQLCNDYIATHPSHHTSLRWLGEKLPAFLRTQQQPVHLCELAEFEWAQIMAFDAADSDLANTEDLRALPQEKWLSLCLEFHPSMQRVSLRTNAPAIWSAYVKNDVLETISIEVADEPQAWLIWREDLQVVYRPIEPSEACALDKFLAGHDFTEVCGDLCNWYPEAEVPLQAARCLQQWLSAGLIAGLR
jgi:hypothetical protein